MSEIAEQVYPSRIEAIRTLQGDHPGDLTKALSQSADALAASADRLGAAPGAKVWRCFAEAVRCLALAEEGRVAILSAAPDADRFLRAARARWKALDVDDASTTFERDIKAALAPLTEDDPDVGALCTAVRSIPMPVLLSPERDPGRERRAPTDGDTGSKPEDLAVAFLEFAIDGRPAEQIHWLAPGETHDLEIVVRASRWPDGADTLRLSPVTLEARTTFDLPVFMFDPPKGPPPYTLQRRGRMVLHSPQALAARPYEFQYAAEFEPLKSEQPVLVAGQRRLRLDGSRAGSARITGYPGVDRKLFDLRDHLRGNPSISEAEVSDALILLAAIGNFMGRAVQDALYPAPVTEARFQADLRAALRQDPRIGADLEEQAETAGGRTDLSFRGIRLELKSERERALTLADCKAYVPQTAMYAVGSNRRLAILCVLDASLKSDTPFPVEEGLAVAAHQTAQGQVQVVVCLIQGGMPKPSHLSR